jgi:hypothetical protein
VLWNRALSKISEPREQQITGGWKNYIMRNLIICTLQQVVDYKGHQINEGEMGGSCRVHDVCKISLCNLP